jgi:hypothetical protein
MAENALIPKRAYLPVSAVPVGGSRPKWGEVLVQAESIGQSTGVRWFQFKVLDHECH